MRVILTVSVLLLATPAAAALPIPACERTKSCYRPPVIRDCDKTATCPVVLGEPLTVPAPAEQAPAPDSYAREREWADRALIVVDNWKACLSRTAGRYARQSSEAAETVADAARGRCAQEENALAGVMRERGIEPEPEMRRYWERQRSRLLAAIIEARAK